MKKNKIDNSVKITGMIIVAVLIITFGVIGLTNATMNKKTITSTGEAVVTVIPDMVSVNFNVETLANTSKEAKDENAEIVDAVIKALITKGFEREEIETSNFNIYEDFEWTKEGRNFLGYKATHSLKVKFNPSHKDVGAIVDAGVNAGALLQYINFELSQDLENEYKAQALKKAGVDAKSKAAAMATGVGAKLGKLVSVSSSDFNYYPWMAYESEGIMLDSAGTDEISKAIATSIETGNQEISGRITVIYEIK